MSNAFLVKPNMVVRMEIKEKTIPNAPTAKAYLIRPQAFSPALSQISPRSETDVAVNTTLATRSRTHWLNFSLNEKLSRMRLPKR